MEEMKRNPEAVARCIRDAQTIAVVSHVNPDGDTLGSATAMYLALRCLGKDVSLFCDGKVPDQLSFLPGADQFRMPDADAGPFDLMLSVDVSDVHRLGKSAVLMERCRMTAQIDHHPTNPLFADVNSVDGSCPATCVIIREQLATLGVPLTEDIAVCLYTGISTDTGNFAFSGTNTETFRIMGELMEVGLPLAKLSRILFRVRRREQAKLMGRALESLEFTGDGSIAVMKLTQQDFDECHALSEHADTLVNFGLDTVGTRMAVLARQSAEGEVKFSLRSNEPFRVDGIATGFGGGGHPQASGITMAGELDECLARVVRAMQESMADS